MKPHARLASEHPSENTPRSNDPDQEDHQCRIAALFPVDGVLTPRDLDALQCLLKGWGTDNPHGTGLAFVTNRGELLVDKSGTGARDFFAERPLRDRAPSDIVAVLAHVRRATKVRGRGGRNSAEGAHPFVPDEAPFALAHNGSVVKGSPEGGRAHRWLVEAIRKATDYGVEPCYIGSADEESIETALDSELVAHAVEFQGFEATVGRICDGFKANFVALWKDGSVKLHADKNPLATLAWGRVGEGGRVVAVASWYPKGTGHPEASLGDFLREMSSSPEGAVPSLQPIPGRLWSLRPLLPGGVVVESKDCWNHACGVPGGRPGLSAIGRGEERWVFQSARGALGGSGGFGEPRATDDVLGAGDPEPPVDRERRERVERGPRGRGAQQVASQLLLPPPSAPPRDRTAPPKRRRLQAVPKSWGCGHTWGYDYVEVG